MRPAILRTMPPSFIRPVRPGVLSQKFVGIRCDNELLGQDSGQGTALGLRPAKGRGYLALAVRSCRAPRNTGGPYAQEDLVGVHARRAPGVGVRGYDGPRREHRHRPPRRIQDFTANMTSCRWLELESDLLRSDPTISFSILRPHLA